MLRAEFDFASKKYIYENLNEDDVLRKEDVDWDFLCKYSKISEDFIDRFSDKVKWKIISSHQKLSESFIRKWADKIYWKGVSSSQELSIDFIREYKDKLDWKHISSCQHLGERFIKEFVDYFDPIYLRMNTSLTFKLNDYYTYLTGIVLYD